MASLLINGSPTSKFQFHCGLKQGDPLAPFLFILIMESLHLSFARAIEAGIFKGIKVDSSLMISHLFYADDAVFIGEWSKPNLKGIMQVLQCFALVSGLKINLKKRPVRGGAESHQLDQLQSLIGPIILSSLDDRWRWDLNGEGIFRVQDARNLLDEFFLPKDPVATRWVKSVPIKEEENDDKVIQDSFQSIFNEYNIAENSPGHVENSSGQMENSPDHVENFNVHVENSHEQLENSPDCWVLTTIDQLNH
ncbi:RNA-directed DNA polymerase, eukaryota [Tanacetum coccineum]